MRKLSICLICPRFPPSFRGRGHALPLMPGGLPLLAALAPDGHDVTLIDEVCFEDLHDAVFVGEADETWPAFLHALSRGEAPKKRYEQAAPTDVIQLPPSRLDPPEGATRSADFFGVIPAASATHLDTDRREGAV